MKPSISTAIWSVSYRNIWQIFYFFSFFSNTFSAGVLCPLPTEIFIQSYRPAAYAFNGATNWIQLFFLGLLFPFIVVSKARCFEIFCLEVRFFLTPEITSLFQTFVQQTAGVNHSLDGLLLFTQRCNGSVVEPQNAANCTQSNTGKHGKGGRDTDTVRNHLNVTRGSFPFPLCPIDASPLCLMWKWIHPALRSSRETEACAVWELCKEGQS